MCARNAHLVPYACNQTPVHVGEVARSCKFGLLLVRHAEMQIEMSVKMETEKERYREAVREKSHTWL